eukprot:TRINITY_DN40506_c0_g1_i1.p1 TRINITY_DN40506_c0_g1~~TRINITY_DN40506_c0_g1_i1.p1  ORF type:complete len:440 (+),score=72.84 TRINITY_DN40506_c0_g1_i1:37-1320(+)
MACGAFAFSMMLLLLLPLVVGVMDNTDQATQQAQQSQQSQQGQQSQQRQQSQQVSQQTQQTQQAQQTQQSGIAPTSQVVVQEDDVVPPVVQRMSAEDQPRVTSLHVNPPPRTPVVMTSGAVEQMGGRTELPNPLNAYPLDPFSKAYADGTPSPNAAMESDTLATDGTTVTATNPEDSNSNDPNAQQSGKTNERPMENPNPDNLYSMLEGFFGKNPSLPSQFVPPHVTAQSVKGANTPFSHTDLPSIVETLPASRQIDKDMLYSTNQRLKDVSAMGYMPPGWWVPQIPQAPIFPHNLASPNDLYVPRVDYHPHVAHNQYYPHFSHHMYFPHQYFTHGLIPHHVFAHDRLNPHDFYQYSDHSPRAIGPAGWPNVQQAHALRHEMLGTPYLEQNQWGQRRWVHPPGPAYLGHQGFISPYQGMDRIHNPAA